MKKFENPGKSYKKKKLRIDIWSRVVFFQLGNEILMHKWY